MTIESSVMNIGIFFVYRTTNQALNLAKSMCHDILKEEDDEVESIHDDHDDDEDDILDEKNGNSISAKLTSLTLNDNDNSDLPATGVNGSTNINDSDLINATKSKKKTKKGTNSKISTGIECDSNDNKIDDESNESELEANDEERLALSGDIIKDDIVNVHA